MQQMGTSSTAVKSCLPIPLHCSVIDRTQHASHSMQVIACSRCAPTALLSKAAYQFQAHCIALQGDRCSTICKSQHAAEGYKQHCSIISIAVTWRELSSQHHTAVKSCLQIPGPLHCRVTNTAQLASHNMQQMGTSITAALCSIAVT